MSKLPCNVRMRQTKPPMNGYHREIFTRQAKGRRKRRAKPADVLRRLLSPLLILTLTCTLLTACSGRMEQTATDKVLEERTAEADGQTAGAQDKNATDTEKNKKDAGTTDTGNSAANNPDGNTSGGTDKQKKKDFPKLSPEEMANATPAFDLSAMESNMVYSTVFNMVTKPYEYKGAIVKMRGRFAAYPADETVNAGCAYYYACVIADAAGCCQQGMEFLLQGSSRSREVYPKDGAAITVIGRFEIYKEGNRDYCRITDAVLL